MHARIPIDNADTHAIQDFQHLHCGFSQTWLGWLEVGNVLNTRAQTELRASSSETGLRQ